MVLSNILIFWDTEFGVFISCQLSSKLKEINTLNISVCVEWMYTLYKFYFLNGISEINQLFDDILIIWPAPVCIYIVFSTEQLHKIHFKVLLKTQLYSKTSYLTLSRLLIFQQENKIHCLVLITIFVTLQWSIMNKLKNGPSWHNNMLQQQAIFQGLYFRFERLVPEWQNHPLNEIKRVLQYSRIL